MLLEDLGESTNTILESLADAKSDSQVLRLARLFQNHYRVHAFLKMTPELAQDEITKQLREIQENEFVPIEPNAPPFPPARQALLQQLEQLQQDNQ